MTATMPTTPVKINKVEQAKLDKDGFDVLQDILRYSEGGDFDALKSDAAGKTDLEVRFKWFGVYQQKPNNGHFMFRIKIPGGQLTPAQLRTIGDLSERYGRGFADITTRQDIQLHWITLKDLKPMFEALWAAGMTSQFACGDTPRNLVSCPLSGVAKHELIDTSGYAKAISDLYLAGGREFSNLPRKFKASIGGCPDYCWLPHIHDYALFAVRQGGRPEGAVGFGLIVGGGLSDTPHLAQPLHVFVRPDQVMDVARGLVVLFRDHGYRAKRNHARLKFLVAEKGWQWTRNTLEEVLGYELEHDDSIGWPDSRVDDHMGIGLQNDGNHYVGVPIERGRWTSRNMHALADLSQRFATGPRRIRLSVRQNALLLDVPKANLADLSKALEDHGLPSAAHPLRTSLIACTGTEFCNLAVVETKHRAGRVLGWLEQNVPAMDQPVSISFTGCPNACAHYQICDIGLTGIPVVVPDQDEPGKTLKVDGYNVWLGAGLGADPRFGEVVAKKIRGDMIHLSIKNLLDHYLAERVDDEESFRSWVRRNPAERLEMLILGPTQAAQAEALVA